MNETHLSQTPDGSVPQSQQNGLLTDFKKLIPGLVLTVLTAFGTSWYNSQQNQAELRNKIERLEEKAERNASNIAQGAAVSQQNTIRLAEVGIIQNNFAEQIKDLKQDTHDLKSRLESRR